ncbi:molybdenum cofactor guanylyltransferase [Chloroflexota bacterium]
MTAIMLAGGRSRRLGREKAQMTVAGESLLERVTSRVGLLCTRVIVVAAQGQQLAAPYCGAEIIADMYPGKGPLGGIYTGLLASDSFHSLVVACDMPFLNLELLRYMVELAPELDVVVPLSHGMPEPLHSIYSKNCLPHMERLLEQGDLRIADFFPRVRVRLVQERDSAKFDPLHLSFFNINTRADLERAQELAQREALGRPLQ